jgi:hypothetical protein
LDVNSDNLSGIRTVDSIGGLVHTGILGEASWNDNPPRGFRDTEGADCRAGGRVGVGLNTLMVAPPGRTVVDATLSGVRWIDAVEVETYRVSWTKLDVRRALGEVEDPSPARAVFSDIVD